MAEREEEPRRCRRFSVHGWGPLFSCARCGRETDGQACGSRDEGQAGGAGRTKEHVYTGKEQRLETLACCELPSRLLLVHAVTRNSCDGPPPWPLSCCRVAQGGVSDTEF